MVLAMIISLLLIPGWSKLAIVPIESNCNNLQSEQNRSSTVSMEVR